MAEYAGVVYDEYPPELPEEPDTAVAPPEEPPEDPPDDPPLLPLWRAAPAGHFARVNSSEEAATSSAATTPRPATGTSAGAPRPAAGTSAGTP